MPSGFVNYDDISYKNMNGEADPAGSLSPFTFLCMVTILAFYGLLMLYSASYEKAVLDGLGHYHYFIRQLLTAFAAVATGYLLSMAQVKVLLKGWYVLLPVTVLTAAASLIPGFSENGHIVIDDLVLIQPGLLAAITSTLIVADLLPDLKPLGGNIDRKCLLALLSLAVLMVSSALTSGLGYYVLVVLIAIPALKVKGLPLWLFLLFLALSLLGAVLFALFLPVGSMYPELDSAQAETVLNAIRDGGLAGVGIGAGLYKLEALVHPESYQIFAVIIEETGFVGYILYLILFCVVVIIGYRTSGRARRRNDTGIEALSLALTVFLAAPAVLCPLYGLSLLPLPGLLLPFVSYSLPGEFLTVLAACILYRLVYIEGRPADA